MTHQPASSEFAVIRSRPANLFAELRSNCIDAFARLETTICRCIIHFDCGLDAKKVPLSHRLATLATVKPGPQLSKERAADLAKLTQSCVQLLTTRGSMVHSVMALGEADGQPVALFQNAADDALGLPIYLVLTPGGFGEVEATARTLANKLNGYLAPPTARHPQPRPASAGAGS